MDKNRQIAGHRITTSQYPYKQFRILVAEDDEVIRRIIQMSLQHDGYTVDMAANGAEALEKFNASPSDLVILDINMPKLNGYAACQELRKRTDVPIIIVTTKSRTDDIVTGYKLGADIYITKPFSPKELLARIRALLRRIAEQHETQSDLVLVAGEISLNDDTHEVFIGDEPVNLSPNEYDLLHFFLSNPNAPVTKETLLETIWGYDDEEDANLVRVTVRRLRSKIEPDPSVPTYLQTVRGVGYKFVVDNTTSPESVAV